MRGARFMRGRPAMRALIAYDRWNHGSGGDQQSPCVRDHTKWTDQSPGSGVT